MGQRERLGNKIKSVFRRICCRHQETLDASVDVSEADLEEGGIKQYRLEAARTVRKICVEFIPSASFSRH